MEFSREILLEVTDGRDTYRIGDPTTPDVMGPEGMERYYIQHIIPYLKRIRYESILGISAFLLILIPLPRPPPPKSLREFFKGIFILPDFRAIWGGRKEGDWNLVTTHDLIKSYGVIAMVCDHTAKVLGPFEKAVAWTVPAQAGGALIFYFLAGANFRPESATGIRKILAVLVLMETAIRLQYISNETLLTIAIIRTVVTHATYDSKAPKERRGEMRETKGDNNEKNPRGSWWWCEGNGSRVWMHAVGLVGLLFVHFLWGNYVMGLLSYGAASLAAAFAGALRTQVSLKKGSQFLMWFWIGVATLLQGFLFWDLTKSRLDLTHTSHMVVLAISPILSLTQAYVFGRYTFRKLKLPSWGLALSVRFLSKASLFIYLWHIVIFQLIVAPEVWVPRWTHLGINVDS
ncbi:hypothetical protein AAMO2058_000585300 [Amorphochlora amoebiformis]